MTQRVTASVGLLWTFVLLSASSSRAAASSSAPPHERLRGQALDDAKLSLTQYANGVLAPRMIYGTTQGRRQLDLDRPPRPGRAPGHPERQGLEHRRTSPGRTSHRSGSARSSRSTASSPRCSRRRGDRRAQHAERRGGFRSRPPSSRTTSIEVYAPSSQDSTRSSAPTRSTQTPTHLRPPSPAASARCGSRAPCSSPSSGCSSCCSPGTPRGCFAIRPTSLRERSASLSESYRLLEESSVEAIESLNATVEAKVRTLPGTPSACSGSRSPSPGSSACPRRTSTPSAKAASSTTSARSRSRTSS